MRIFELRSTDIQQCGACELNLRFDLPCSFQPDQHHTHSLSVFAGCILLRPCRKSTAWRTWWTGFATQLRLKSRITWTVGTFVEVPWMFTFTKWSNMGVALFVLNSYCISVPETCMSTDVAPRFLSLPLSSSSPSFSSLGSQMIGGAHKAFVQFRSDVWWRSAQW